MNESILLAIIAAISSGWHDVVTNMGAVAAGVIALATFVMQAWSKWSDKKDREKAEAARLESETARTMLAEKLDRNTELTKDIKVAAVRSTEEMQTAVKGAERSGVELGIDIERKRASGFDPLKTDVDIQVNQ